MHRCDTFVVGLAVLALLAFAESNYYASRMTVNPGMHGYLSSLYPAAAFDNTVACDVVYKGQAESEDTLYAGLPHAFRLWIENAFTLYGISLGFEIWSDDGATWTWDNVAGYGDLTGCVTPIPGSRMDPDGDGIAHDCWDNSDLLVTDTEMDGVSPDLILFGGLALDSGLLSGTSDPMLEIHFTPTSAAHTICIDSIFIPPAGEWIFSDAEGLPTYPQFDGPYCWPIVSCPDVDTDDVCDLLDNCPETPNTDQQNSDTDELGDACDNCPNHSNSDQADADGDDIGDVCDACPNDSNNDIDGDGVCGDIDNCPVTYNPTQTDADDDGIGDVCDECTDVDTDGFGNPGYTANTCPEDNCPSVYNPGQADTDSDTAGDVCDNCPATYNPTQSDADGDGMGNACDGVYNVTILGNTGIGSLRNGISHVNNSVDVKTMEFGVSGVIALESTLPPLTADDILIDGYSAPGGEYSVIIDGSALSGGNGILIESSGNTIRGLVIDGFPDNGIAVTGTGSVGNTLTSNLIYGIGGLPIDLGNDGVTANDAADTDTGPNTLLNFPEIDAIEAQEDETYIIYGRAAPNSMVEFYMVREACDSATQANALGHGDTRAFVGVALASIDGDFAYHETSVPHFSLMCCTAIDPLGNTSEISANFNLLPTPLVVAANTYSASKGADPPENGVNIMITDPSGQLFGMDANNNIIDEIPGEQLYIVADKTDSVIIPDLIIGDYIIDFVGTGGAGTESLYSGIIKVDGSQECILIVDGDIPGTGQLEGFNYSYEEETFTYINGDANSDSDCNVGDAVYIINYVFKSGPAPVPVLSGDANCDGDSNVGDAVYIINFVFKGGPEPCYHEW